MTGTFSGSRLSGWIAVTGARSGAGYRRCGYACSVRESHPICCTAVAGLWFRLTRWLPCISCAALWFGNQRVRDSCADGSEGAEPNLEPCAEGDYTLFYAAAFLFGIMDCAIQVRSRCC